MNRKLITFTQLLRHGAAYSAAVTKRIAAGQKVVSDAQRQTAREAEAAGRVGRGKKKAGKKTKRRTEQ